MLKSNKAGLFAALSPPVYISEATLGETVVPTESKGHPLLKLYQETETPCTQYITEDGTSVFECECIVLDMEETQEILNSDLEVHRMTISDYLTLQKEALSD